MLVTERLCLRPVRPTDLEDYFLIFGDPEIARFDEYEPFDREHIAAELARAAAAHATGEAELEFAVVEQATSRVIGVITLKRTGEGTFLGYHFNREFHGRGFAVEAARAVVRTPAFHGHGSLRAKVHADNARSIRILDRLGFRETGRAPDSRGRPELHFEGPGADAADAPRGT